MPSLTWKLIALLTLIFAVAVFLWFIFLGPLSYCARQWQNCAVAERLRLFENDLSYHGCRPHLRPLWDIQIVDQESDAKVTGYKGG